MTALGKPTLHHLNNSASQRVLWALEELEIDYDLVKHTRIKDRAPPELRKTHPLGKAPQLVLADGRTLIESSTILRYLIETYDTEKKFRGDGDAIREQELSDFVSSTMNYIMTIGVIFVALVHHSPFIVRPLMSGIWKSLRGAFYDVEVDLYMSYLNDQLKGRDFLLGSAPGRPDFLLSFVYDTMEQKQMIKQPNKYPLLHEWNNRCKARPAWVRSLEKGNGYDMSRFE